MAEETTSDTRTNDRGGTDLGSSGGYVHDPSMFEEGSDEERDANAAEERSRTTRAYHPEVPQSEEFGTKGWLLVAAILVAFVVVPVAILLIPYSTSFIESLGLTWRDAYLTLPLVPAIVLAALAVWVAVSD